MDKRSSVVVCALLIIIGASLTLWNGRKAPGVTKPSTVNITKYTHVDIVLKNGKLVGAEPNYLVQPGVALEFSVTSDRLGKIGVPTDPAQIITFTQSPVIFHFTVGNKSGAYPLSFQANGSKDVIEIGLISIRGTK